VVNSSAQIKFDDAGKPILAQEFDYAAVEGAEVAGVESNRAVDALQALQHGLMIVIEDGPSDAALVRAGALARLCSFYATDAEAASAVHVHRSTMMRAVRRLRNKIIRATQLKKTNLN
jgi:hypothetical protein